MKRKNIEDEDYFCFFLAFLSLILEKVSFLFFSFFLKIVFPLLLLLQEEEF
jgi:hypothetical protein